MEHSGSLPPPLFSVSLGPSVSLSLCSLLSRPLSFSPQSLREQSLGHEFWGEGDKLSGLAFKRPMPTSSPGGYGQATLPLWVFGFHL